MCVGHRKPGPCKTYDPKLWKMFIRARLLWGYYNQFRGMLLNIHERNEKKNGYRTNDVKSRQVELFFATEDTTGDITNWIKGRKVLKCWNKYSRVIVLMKIDGDVSFPLILLADIHIFLKLAEGRKETTGELYIIQGSDADTWARKL